MRVYLTRRFLATIPVLIGVTLLAFLILHLIPGNPVELLAGPEASEEVFARIEQRLGLDRPLYVQYFTYVKNLLGGDMGYSFRTRRTVSSELLTRYPTSLGLTLGALFIGSLFGIIFGVISATKRHSIWDTASSFIAMAGVSIPRFWLGIVLIYFFSVRLQLLPSMGFSTYKHWIMPCATLSVYSLALVMRMTRSSVLEVCNEDYVRTARAKGLSERVVIYKHALRNALIPTVTVITLSLGYLIGGAVVVETVFNINGVGRLIIDSILARDIPLVQGGMLFIALNFVIANLIADLVYGLLDPRIRYE